MTDTLTLQDIEDLARWALDEHGLTDWSVKWDRATRRLGQCRYSRKEIGLSKPVFQVEANRELALNTILHEVAHALAPGHGHGPVWQVKAIALGAEPRSCSALAESPTLPIVGLCECEPAIHQMSRMPKRSYTCNRCHARVRWVRR